MKQVFEIEWEHPERPGMSAQVVAHILNQYGPNDIKFVRDITPKWTKELPKVEGWYWFHEGKGTERMYHLQTINGELCMRFWGTEWSKITEVISAVTEWSGPIPMPEEEK